MQECLHVEMWQAKLYIFDVIVVPETKDLINSYIIKNKPPSFGDVS